MSSGKALSIVALIIGISGLGLGIYTFVFPPVQVQVPNNNFEIQETWFNYYSTDVYTNPIASFIVVDPLRINFTVNPGEMAYFLYIGMAAVFGSGLSLIQINFVLDGIIQTHPIGPQLIFASKDADQYGSVALQTTKTLSPGSHNLTISLWGTNSSNGVTTNSLLIQTFTT
ncbi:MAG: hypothetical protein ACFFAA_13665 [Promethearchaeota archaeon]